MKNDEYTYQKENLLSLALTISSYNKKRTANLALIHFLSQQAEYELSPSVDTANTHARTRHLSHLLCRYVQKIHPSLSHLLLTPSLSWTKGHEAAAASHSLSVGRLLSSPLIFFCFSTPNKQAAAPSIIFPSLREQSSKHELSLSPLLVFLLFPPPQKASTCASFFFLPPPIPLQSNSRASSRAACHHGNEIELRSCTVAMTPASGRSRTGTAAPTPARSQTRSRSWCVARPGWSCTTPHTRRR